MDKNIIDGMKKEGKPFRNLMIMSYALTILMPLSIFLMNNTKYNDKDIILSIVVWFMFGVFGLYGWLYAIKYRVEINKEKIILKTLFREERINICDIEKYTCNRYKKSAFYQFDLFIKNKRIVVNTRYKEELERILKDNKIYQIP